MNENVLTANGTLNGDSSSFTPWTPIKVMSGEKVTLNGNGKTISGLYFNNERNGYVGLFGEVKGTVSISELGIKDSYIKGFYYVGGLVGYNNVGGTLSVTNSYNAGIVTGKNNVGGLVGGSSATLTITNCYNVGTVSGDYYVGGFVGKNYDATLTITNSFFLGEGNNYGGTGKSADEFHNGTVARLLHNYVQTGCKENCIDGTIWGQDVLNGDLLPNFSDKITGTLYDLVLHTFDDDNRSYPMYYLSEKGLELPTDLTRKNYVFLGWSAKETPGSSADIVTSIAKGETGTKTFYAQWMKVNEKGCYEIASGIGLYTFAGYVKNATNGSQVCGTLVENIVVNENVLNTNGALNGDGFTPWTLVNVQSGVQVTLNGAGKTISGLYFNDENTNYVGLFGEVYGTVSISNLDVKDSYFKGRDNVGGFVGRSYAELTITNSYNSGTVSGSGNFVGGLVGYNNNDTLTITNSYNSGTVSGNNGVGGLVGYSYNGTLTIENSYNAGTVSGGHDVGGLVGSNFGGGLTIENSYNSGTVSGSGNDVGGLVGYSNATLTIENSYNEGTVSGSKDNVGGLVGYNNNGTLTVTNSYNAGPVSGSGNFVGGLVGRNGGTLTITSSFFLGEGDNYGGTGKSADEFHNGTVALLLHNWCEMDGDNCKVGGLDGSVWGQDFTKENSLPDLSGKFVGGTPHTLTLHTFEGDTRKLPTIYLEGKGLVLPTDLTRENYVFLGWSAKETAGSSADIVTSIAKGETGKKEFYAQWMKLNADGCYEIASGIALYKFAEIVKNATNGSQVCGTLTKDIVVNENVLTADGALNGVGSSFTPWNPMTVVSGVKVTLDGNGHTISGLYFNDENTDKVGLFDGVKGALFISNLGVKDSYFKGGRYVGGLVGHNGGSGTLTITNSYNVGTVSGDYSVGGLVGHGDYGGTLTITNSYNAGAVSGKGNDVGGLVGYVFDGTLTITNSYNAGTVSGDGNDVGGLVGYGDYGTLTITNSFFLATGKSGDALGGRAKTLDDFHNGTVAKELHDWCEKDGDNCKEGGLNGSVWGQDLRNANSLPDLSGVIGFKYGSVTFFNLVNGKADSAYVNASANDAVDFPDDISVAGPVKFKRTFAGSGYSTIMLPFKPNCEDGDCIKNGENVKFYEFGSYANATVRAIEVSPSALQANTPYLVQAAGVNELVFKNGGTFNTTTSDAYNSETGDYKKVLDDGEGNVNGWTIYGTYAYKKWNAGDAGIGSTYGFAANDGVNDPAIVGEFRKVGVGAYIYPMRAYLEYDAPVVLARPAANGAARAGAANTVASLPETINVVIVDKGNVGTEIAGSDDASGEQTTKVIGTLNTRTGEFKFANDRWFDLQGRYLGSKKSTQKGAYYNNGKKVIVK